MIHSTEAKTYTPAQIEAIEVKSYQRGYKEGISYTKKARSNQHTNGVKATILRDLLKGDHLSTLVFHEQYNCTKFQSRISDVRQDLDKLGITIAHYTAPNKTNAGEHYKYYLTPENRLKWYEYQIITTQSESYKAECCKAIEQIEFENDINSLPF